MKTLNLFSLFCFLSFVGLSLDLAAQAVIEREESCLKILSEVSIACEELEEDYAEDTYARTDEFERKPISTITHKARLLKRMHMTQAQAARAFASECDEELSYVPPRCHSSDEYRDLAQNIEDAKRAATDSDTKARKYEGLAFAAARGPGFKCDPDDVDCRCLVKEESPECLDAQMVAENAGEPASRTPAPTKVAPGSKSSLASVPFSLRSERPWWWMSLENTIDAAAKSDWAPSFLRQHKPDRSPTSAPRDRQDKK